MVEVAGVEPDLAFHEFALICICIYLTAACEMGEMHSDEDKCTQMSGNWQIQNSRSWLISGMI
jgi:hypothetical protein